MFYLPLRLLYGLAALEEDVIGADLGASSKLDPCDLWGHGPYLVPLDVGSAQADMIYILMSLALLKLSFRLWSVNLLCTMLAFVYFGLYLFLVDGLMTSTFCDYLWYYDDVVLYL